MVDRGEAANGVVNPVVNGVVNRVTFPGQSNARAACAGARSRPLGARRLLILKGYLPVSARRRHQPLTVLAPLAGALPVTGAHAPTSLLAQLAPHARLVGPATIVAAVALLTLAVLAGWLRCRHVGRLLASRETRVLVPADTHDPSMEDVVRFAAQLHRVRRRGRARLERPAAAIRIRIHSAPGGRLAFELDAPAHARGVIATAMGAYPDIELGDPTAMQPDDNPTAPS